MPTNFKKYVSNPRHQASNVCFHESWLHVTHLAIIIIVLTYYMGFSLFQKLLYFGRQRTGASVPSTMWVQRSPNHLPPSLIHPLSPLQCPSLPTSLPFKALPFFPSPRLLSSSLRLPILSPSLPSPFPFPFKRGALRLSSKNF